MLGLGAGDGREQVHLFFHPVCDCPTCVIRVSTVVTWAVSGGLPSQTFQV